MKYRKIKPRYFPYMNQQEWIEFMEEKGFHFSDEKKAAAKAKDEQELKKDDPRK